LELKLYDTLTREKRVFHPIDPARVRMYVCGPTVYDYAHIGNARPVIVFDVLFRLLRHLYGAGHVTYVRNITDVDDKINARAAERGISIRDLTEETYANFKADIASLGCLPPTIEPRATEHIEEMKTLIERLVASGHAYVAEGHVLFSVPSMKDYGRLSNRSLDEMIAGARVEVAPYKKDATDFVLWKPSKEGEPGWPSPCGIKTPGRPGWHIECSAMSWKHLGETFDIHGGGIDLVFPHHENEIAQGARVDLVVDVGDVAHIGDVIGAIDMAQQPKQHVEDDDRPRIADMGEVIDRRAAYVHAHVLRIDGDKILLRPRQRIIQAQAFRSLRHPFPSAHKGASRKSSLLAGALSTLRER
jgi:cysteinyl-tRNA synthetase